MYILDDFALWKLNISVSPSSLCVSRVIAAAVRQPDQHGQGRKLSERRPQRHAEGERGPEGTSQGRPAESAGQRGPSQGLLQW